MAFRQLKQQVLSSLLTQEAEAGLAAIVALPGRQVINALLGLLYHDQELVRWRAVTAIGSVVSRLADQNLESARVIMRRLMWSLNDESGGIGWGSPEAMGEIMACHEQLSLEYGSILISYLDPEGNYLEHEGLQQGVLWAIGRLGRARPQRVWNARPFLLAFFSSSDARLRGLSAWASAPILDQCLRQGLEPLQWDPALFSLYCNGRCAAYSVAETALAALAA